MTLAIQALDCDSPKVLHITLSVERPDSWVYPNYTSVTPAEIKNMIALAIKDGWSHDAGGSAYEFEFGIICHPI